MHLKITIGVVQSILTTIRRILFKRSPGFKHTVHQLIQQQYGVHSVVSPSSAALSQRKPTTAGKFIAFRDPSIKWGGPGSVVGIVTGYGLDGPGIESRWVARFSAPVQTGLGAHPASCTMGTGYFPGVKSGRGVTLTPHPLLVPWSRKSTAIPLLPLWAVRPVHSLSACKRAQFTFFF